MSPLIDAARRFRNRAGVARIVDYCLIALLLAIVAGASMQVFGSQSKDTSRPIPGRM
jgi:hypothetical protein